MVTFMTWLMAYNLYGIWTKFAAQNFEVTFYLAQIGLVFGEYLKMVDVGAVNPELAQAKILAIEHIINLMYSHMSYLHNNPVYVQKIYMQIYEMVYLDTSCSPEYLDECISQVVGIILDSYSLKKFI